MAAILLRRTLNGDQTIPFIRNTFPKVGDLRRKLTKRTRNASCKSNGSPLC